MPEHLDRAGDVAAPAAYLAAARAEADVITWNQRGALSSGDWRSPAKVRTGLLWPARMAMFCATSERQQSQSAAFEEALRAATDDVERCQARIGLARGMRIADRIDEALATLDAAEAIATGRQRDLNLAWIHHLRGNFYFPLGRVEGCAAEHMLALDHARRAKSGELETRALGGLGDAAYAQGRMASAYRNFSGCVELMPGRMATDASKSPTSAWSATA